MNRAETALLLALIKQFDNRQFDQVIVEAWHELLDDVEHADAVAAVKNHFRESTEYLKPAHVRHGALTAAKRRAGQERITELAAQERRAIEATATGADPERTGAPVRDRSEDLRRLLGDLSKKLGPGKPEQLRWADPTLHRPRAATPKDS